MEHRRRLPQSLHPQRLRAPLESDKVRLWGVRRGQSARPLRVRRAIHDAALRQANDCSLHVGASDALACTTKMRALFTAGEGRAAIAKWATVRFSIAACGTGSTHNSRADVACPRSGGRMASQRWSSPAPGPGIWNRQSIDPITPRTWSDSKLFDLPCDWWDRFVVLRIREKRIFRVAGRLLLLRQIVQGA